MIRLGWALARGTGRDEALRVALVALGTALGTQLLLAAAAVLSIPEGGSYRFGHGLLDEAGLRGGVAFALALMLVPVLVFLAMCARVGAARRHRRLAALRLAGATPAQVRALAVLEAGVACALGSVLGVVVFEALVVRLLPSGVGDGAGASGPASTVPLDFALAPGVVAAIALAVPLLGAASAALGLRGLVITPLGVARRAPRRPPSARPLLALAVGVVALWVSLPVLRIGEFVWVLLWIGVAAIALGLVLGTAWLSARMGAVLAGRARRPALLIAARRLEANPRGQARAPSAVLVCVLFAAGAATLRSIFQQGGAFGPQEEFYDSSFALVDLALLVSAVVGVAGLFVGSAEGIIERRRSLASLVGAGVPRGVLARAVVLEALLPLLAMAPLAALVGAVAVRGVGLGALAGLPLGRLALVVAVAYGLSALAVALTLPLLRHAVGPDELRAE